MRALRNILSATVLTFAFAALAWAIWIGLPILGIDVLARADTRIGLISGIAAILAILSILRRRSKRKAAGALEQSLLRGQAGDGAVLAERMRDAVAQLKAKGGSTALYDLPWYVLIGPPGSGKTTALLHSGIDFPGTDPSSIAGFGGTRNCDFWFAQEAVMIDTAGRYTTQDSDVDADRASWASFLGQLKGARPDQPINGIILTLSCEDLITAGGGVIRDHAETVRARLYEVYATLKVQVPVYVVFTKADMIAGFREFFGSFDEARRRLVWGATVQAQGRVPDIAPLVAEEFRNLTSRLTDEVSDRLIEELDSQTRISLFGFPTQFAMLEPAVAGFLTRVFDPAHRRAGAVLRGFYFTSGTQEGSPIDQVLGAQARRPDMAAGFMSGRGRSFFLHDLLKKVIFAERAWAGYDKGRMLRRSISRGFAKTIIVSACLAGALSLGVSFWNSASVVRAADQQRIGYANTAQRALSERRVENAATRPLLPALNAVRVLPTGYANPTPAPSIPVLGLPEFGLARDTTLRPAAIDAYSRALEQLLRPRMMLLIERRLAAALTEGEDIDAYRALKVYILLAKEQDGRDDDLAIQAYFAEAWSEEYATPGSDADYRAINAHLAAMLSLDDRATPLIKPNGALVERTREALAEMPLADQVFAAIEAEAAVLPPLSLIAYARDLQTNDGRAPVTLTVPGFYRFDGYWGFFQEALATLESRVAAETWVLGARTVGFAEMADLPDALNARYALGFEAAWSEVLERVAGRSGPETLVPLVEGVAAEVHLSRAFQAGAVDVPLDVPQGTLRQWAETVEAPMAQWIRLARGAEGARRLDRLAATVDQVALNPSAWPAAMAEVRDVPPAVARLLGHTGLSGARGALMRDVTGMCQQKIMPFYPFGPVGSAPLPMADFAAFFGYGGQMDVFWRTYGAQKGAVQLPVGDRVRKDFEAADQLREALFAPGSRVPDMGLRVWLAGLPEGVARVTLDLGQGPQELSPGGEGYVLRWPAEVTGVALEIAMSDGDVIRARVPGGAWSVVSLMRGAQSLRSSGNRAQADIAVADVVLRLIFEAEGARDMPLASPVWREFVCPVSLE